MKSSSTFITLPYALERPTPPFEGDDIRYPESLVRYFLKRFTKRGDNILDPFTGLGTTLFTAQEMGRNPFGVEADVRRHAWVAGQLEAWPQLVCGDSNRLAVLGFPRMDFCMTSPPYMPRHHKWNPLFAGNPAKAGYDVYLKQMRRIFEKVAGLMKRNAVIVVQADNLGSGRHYTPLVRDLSLAISKTLRLEDEIIVQWKGGRPDYRHTHCLLFRNI